MKGGVGFMSQMHGNTGYQSAMVVLQSICRSLPEPILEQPGTSHVALPRTHHEKAERPPRTHKEKPVTQQPGKEIRPEIFSGHVAPASHAHEQVTSTKTANQGTKEATIHSSGPQ